MSIKAEGLPEKYPTVTAYLTIRGAAKAIEFYKQAFGAKELTRSVGPDGQSLWHAQVKIGDSIVMMSDEFPEAGHTASPETLGGTTCALQLTVADADASFKRAVDAGAKVVMPPDDMFWGDRYGIVTDPFGHRWAFCQPLEQLTMEEARARAAAMYGAAQGRGRSGEAGRAGGSGG